ncbi:hypothetical protein [Bacteroides pyogenes]|uniref:hypothetical protein n=1 Tax=Bacteroides pyogenes TaxID=310300 RepID=UPI002A80783F|nr:hypothetical protein [Bacteroides pyogenes]MDY4250799.1 hypothetical protein [Bacteroides pyogenes]
MEENIIVIRNTDKFIALQYFDELMLKTTDFLNKEAYNMPKRYQSCNGKDLEFVVWNAMRNMCTDSPFRKEDIELVSGQSFPDIIANKYYGVEVKSTKEDHWRSTGSSIIESTRNKNVENIYMLFGKLGGIPIQFRCKPYNLCLYDIAVTHSPRYLIDMDLQEQSEKTIFQKMGVSYDDFRLSENPIKRVRSYYYQKALKEKRKEMPWWISSEETALNMNVSLWVEDKGSDNIRNNLLRAQMFILFPEEILRSDFDKAALWLCIRHSIVNSHIRDTFSAGGQCLEVDGEKLPFRLPKVIGRLLDSSEYIIRLLSFPSSFDSDLRQFRPDLHGKERLDDWLNQIETAVYNIRYKLGNSFTTIKEQGGIPIKDWILNGRKITAYYSKGKK